MSVLCSTATAVMSAATTAEHYPRPPPSTSTRRLSISFRKINQALGTITHIDIFTGSLTGTSERFAASLADKATQRGAIVSLKSLEDFDPRCFNDPNGPYHSTSRVTVFVVSTHFAGGPSPNAEAFSQWLRLASGDYGVYTVDPKPTVETQPTDTATPTPTDVSSTTGSTPAENTPDTTQDPTSVRLRRLTRVASPRSAPRPRRQSSFSAAIRPLLRMNWRNAFNTGNGSASSSKLKNPLHGVQYAIFGVGNSMYLTYNAMAKFVDARLQTLGAVRLCPLGLGDVSNDIDDAFAKWEAQLLQLLACQKPGPPAGIAAEAQEAASVQYRMTPTTTESREQSVVPATAVTQSLPPSKQSCLDASPREGQMVLPRQSSGIGSPVKLSMQDHYGRHVRLRFRCRYVNKQEAKPPTRFKLPTLATSSNASSRIPRKLSRRQSSMRRDATHIRHPCVALQSITMLKHIDTNNGDCQANTSTLKDVSLARLVLLDPELTFETADTFGYFPPNSMDDVEAIGSRLGLDMGAFVELSFHEDVPTADAVGESVESEASYKNKDRHLPFPSPCRIRTILSDFLELRVISREFVRVASGFVTDQKEHELLENLASIDGSADFTREFGQASSGLMKMLELVPSLRMPFEVFVNITPLLKPRLYSIASSHVKNDREFDIVVALGNPNAVHGLSVANFRRILSKSETQLPVVDITDTNTTGVLTQTTQVSIPIIRMLRGFVATSLFKPPSDLHAPMIMIANGIGVAPLRALLQHREFEVEDSKCDLSSQQTLPHASPVLVQSGSSCGKNLLLLGCSNRTSILFESELRDWEAKGFLELHVVHSSEPGQPAQYVQDLVDAQKQQISALMSSSPESRIYICGKVAMARAVHQILAAPDTTNGSNSWYQKALQSGRYIEGVFG